MMPSDNFRSEASASPTMRISVVDDDASFLRSVGRLLRSAGFAVETFPSARQFLASLSTTSTQCLLLDVQMPEMTGLELQEHLAARGCCVPIIFVTAYDTPQTRQRARHAGAFGLLLKPFDKEALVTAIHKAVAVETKEFGPEEPKPAHNGARRL